jgi:hypothetical protein
LTTVYLADLFSSQAFDPVGRVVDQNEAINRDDMFLWRADHVACTITAQCACFFSKDLAEAKLTSISFARSFVNPSPDVVDETKNRADRFALTLAADQFRKHVITVCDVAHVRRGIRRTCLAVQLQRHQTKPVGIRSANDKLGLACVEVQASYPEAINARGGDAHLTKFCADDVRIVAKIDKCACHVGGAIAGLQRDFFGECRGGQRHARS